MASNEGYSNLAAAILSFLAGRERGRSQRRRDKEDRDREDARAEKAFQRQLQLEKERGLRQDAQFDKSMSFKREVLDRTNPQKTWLGTGFDTLKSTFFPSVAEQSAQADLDRKLITNQILKRGMSTGMQMPGNPTINAKGDVSFSKPKSTGTGKAPKPMDPTKARAQELLARKQGDAAFRQEFDNIVARKLVGKIKPMIESGEQAPFETPADMLDSYIEDLKARGMDEEADAAERNYNHLLDSLTQAWPKRKGLVRRLRDSVGF